MPDYDAKLGRAGYEVTVEIDAALIARQCPKPYLARRLWLREYLTKGGLDVERELVRYEDNFRTVIIYKGFWLEGRKR